MTIYVNGVATTRFGELWDKSLLDLGKEAAEAALRDANLSKHDIDALYVSNMLASKFDDQDHLGAYFADSLGISVPSIHVEAACASGGVALRQAWIALLSGTAKRVMVLGVEKMTDAGGGEVTSGLLGASHAHKEADLGLTFPSLYAMMAREHMNRYGTTREQLALCSVKNHENGALNPHAHFQRSISLEQVLAAPMVASPLGLLDCSPISDGAAAIILSTDLPASVAMVRSEQAGDTIALSDRSRLDTIFATRLASQQLFSSTGVKREEIGVMEVHDCFTIAEIMAIEDLGFAPKGTGGDFVESGITLLNGDLPINTSGGLKAAGHPVGATGIKQAVEVVTQLRGNAGKRQIQKNIHYGLTHNVGGSGATTVVSLFEQL